MLKNKDELKGIVEDCLLSHVNDDFIIEKKAPTELLNYNRFDSIAKYIVTRNYKKNASQSWAKELYKENIRALNNFIENQNNKFGFDNFYDSMLKTIKSIEKEGFNSNKSIIPISKDGTALNGSHRLGISLAINNELLTINTNKEPFSYNYKYLKEKGLYAKYLDYMAINYAKLKKNTHTAILFPIVLDKINQVKEIIQKTSDIVYEKDVYLNRNGVHNLVVQLYRDKDWISMDQNYFAGAIEHSFNRYIPNRPIKILLLESNNMEDLKNSKKQVRKIFNFGNYPIHIADFHEETVRISEQCFNQNSIHFLNHAKYKNNQNFKQFFKEFDDWIKDNKIDKDDFCIDGSAVLATYGLRDCKDFDYLSINDKILETKNIHLHNAHMQDFGFIIDELIYNPKNYFYYNGYKFLTLENLKKLKKKRGQYKDKKDIKLIETVLDTKNGLRKIFSDIKYFFSILPNRIVFFIKKTTPKPVNPIFKKVFKIIKKMLYG